MRQSTPRTVPVSLVMTVRNEGDSISDLLSSILLLTVRPAEIVIVDGGSTDNTVDVIRGFVSELPIRLVEQPGANISEGRNTAIGLAAHEIVAVTDAGVRLDPLWLEKLTEPFERQEEVDVVSGFFVAAPQSAFERAMGATVLPAVGDVNPERFLPSSRSVAFSVDAWRKVGGYPEWLDYCEDLVFDMNLQKAGSRFVFAPDALVYFRPRSRLRAFFTQYYRYARGDGKADLWRKRHAARYLTYTLGPALAIWAWRRRRSAVGKGLLGAAALAGIGYCRRPYARLLPLLSGLALGSRVYVLLLVPAIRVTGDVAKMVGYPVGVVWRLRFRRGS